MAHCSPPPPSHRPLSVGVLAWYSYGDARLGLGVWHMSTAFLLINYNVFAAISYVRLTRQLTRFVTNAPLTFDVSHIRDSIRQIRTICIWCWIVATGIAINDVYQAFNLIQTRDEGPLPFKNVRAFSLVYVVDWFIGLLVLLNCYWASPYPTPEWCRAHRTGTGTNLNPDGSHRDAVSAFAHTATVNSKVPPTSGGVDAKSAGPPAARTDRRTVVSGKAPHSLKAPTVQLVIRDGSGGNQLNSRELAPTPVEVFQQSTSK